MLANTKAFSGFAVDDLEKARAFYADALGLRVDVLDEENHLMALHHPGDRDTLVYGKPDHAPANYTILNFQVDDIDEVVRGLTERGVEFERYEDFDQAIDGVDAVIMLRLQKERMASIELPDETAYFAHYGLDRRRLALAAPGCLVMHPGPINRGIEIASDVADGAQSRILEQVGNGVFVRMAVLNEVLAR